MPDFNQSSYLKFKRRLVTGFFLLIILLILSLAWKIYSYYQNYKKRLGYKPKTLFRRWVRTLLAPFSLSTSLL